MAEGRGITGLTIPPIGSEKRKFYIIHKTQGLDWTGNVRIEKMKEYRIFKYDIHNLLFFLSSKDRLSLIKIDGFTSNNGFIKLIDLYPSKGGIGYCCFLKDRFSLKLITIGSKTIEEVRASGYNRYGKSQIPFLVTVQNQKFITMNNETP